MPFCQDRSCDHSRDLANRSSPTREFLAKPLAHLNLIFPAVSHCIGPTCPVTLFVTLNTQSCHLLSDARLRSATVFPMIALQKQECDQDRELDHIAPGLSQVTI